MKHVAKHKAEVLPPNVSVITKAKLFGKYLIETELDDENIHIPATEPAQTKSTFCSKT